ncbi:MAG: hypothetical protein WB392_12640 [Methanotrichaceae archaeon]
MTSPNHSENAVLIATDSVTTSMLSELSTALEELQLLASKITDLKKETLEREAAVLEEILEKITPLVPLLSEDCEQHYRREIVILTREERVQLKEGLGFFSEYKLILYENGLLVRTHRYGGWAEGPRLGWENTDEDVLAPQAAITAFGLTAISEGLIKVLGAASSMVILKEELERRLAALTKALGALL